MHNQVLQFFKDPIAVVIQIFSNSSRSILIVNHNLSKGLNVVAVQKVFGVGDRVVG